MSLSRAILEAHSWFLTQLDDTLFLESSRLAIDVLRPDTQESILASPNISIGLSKTQFSVPHAFDCSVNSVM